MPPSTSVPTYHSWSSLHLIQCLHSLHSWKSVIKQSNNNDINTIPPISNLHRMSGTTAYYILSLRLSDLRSQTIIEISSEPVRRYCDCFVIAKQRTGPLWPETKAERANYSVYRL